MAADLVDGEFWLPAQFLTDGDSLIRGQNKTRQTKKMDDFSFAFGNSFGPFSDLSSPVESVTGSTETESDEDDYLTELTRKIAQSTIQDSNYPVENNKVYISFLFFFFLLLFVIEKGTLIRGFNYFTGMVGFWFSTINSMQCYG